MNITIASDKGGTGETTFAVNLAYYLNGTGNIVRLLDGDVKESNDHLFVLETTLKYVHQCQYYLCRFYFFYLKNKNGVLCYKT